MGVNAGPFSFVANYVGALRKMVIDHLGNTARLWAMDVGAGYAFKTFSYDSKLGASFQMLGNADKMSPTSFLAGIMGAGIPKNRYIADYSIHVWKNTCLTAAVIHDVRYSGTGWTGNKTATQVVGRFSVAF